MFVGGEIDHVSFNDAIRYAVGRLWLWSRHGRWDVEESNFWWFDRVVRGEDEYKTIDLTSIEWVVVCKSYQ